MPRLIRVFAGRTVVLLVLSCGGSYHFFFFSGMRKKVNVKTRRDGYQIPFEIPGAVCPDRSLSTKMCYTGKCSTGTCISSVCCGGSKLKKCIRTTRPTYCKASTKDEWTASSEFGTYRLYEQRRFRRACASAQSRQNLRCSLIQAVSQEELQTESQIPGPSEWLGMRS